MSTETRDSQADASVGDLPSTKSPAHAAQPEAQLPATGSAMPKVAPLPTRGSLSTSLRTIVTLILCVVALAVGLGIFVALASLKEAPPRRTVAERSYNVTTFVAEQNNYREQITGFGTAMPDRQVVISAEVAGLITEIHPNLEVGVRMQTAVVRGGGPGASRTIPGDQLVKIDPATYQRRIESLERLIGQLEVQRDQLQLEEENELRLLKTQEKNLKTAQSELESKQRARAAGASSATLVRNAELQALQYEEQVVRLKNSIGLFESRKAAVTAQIDAQTADLENAKLDLVRTDVRPPFTGILSDVSVEEGQYVRPGDPIVELTDLARIDVPVALTQSQFARLEPLLAAGEKPIVQLAENETDAPRWTGRVVRAAPVADQITRTVDVYVEVDNAEQKTPLLPGTFVHARISGPVLTDAVVIPRDVVVDKSVYVVGRGEPAESSPDGEASTGYVAVAREVNVERVIQGLSLIRGGVEPGDRVVMTNLDVVHDGASLVPQAEVGVNEELSRQRVPALEVLTAP